MKTELRRKTIVETWVSSENDEKIDFYIDKKFLFSFNPKLISREQVAKFLQGLGYDINPDKWLN